MPAFNEASVISTVIERIKKCGYSNILVIDDGSSDTTHQVAVRSQIKALKFCLNRGVGAATQAAIYYARRNQLEYIVLIDADGQHFPEDIDLLVEHIEKHQADLVIGSRFLDQKSAIPATRKIFNAIANVLTFLGKSKVTDSQSGFRLLNKKAIERINLDLDDYGVCTEMIWKAEKAGLKIVEVPIRVIYTEYSMSKGQNLWKGIQTGIGLVRKLID